MVAVNVYQPHVLVLPEDDADRQIANGFCVYRAVRTRAIQVLPEAGGWLHVRDKLLQELVPHLQRYPKAFVVLLVDFDGQSARREEVLEGLDASLLDRVFVLGSFKEPEDLRSSLGSFESIGRLLAEDCEADTTNTWSHSLLLHNAAELARLKVTARPVVFSHS